jgi:steroid delta-isomerase-like uncharacterized protein
MDNRDIFRKQLEAFGKGDWATYKSFINDDTVYDEEATQRIATGPDEIVQVAEGWKAAFPDGRGTIKNIVATGDAVVAEIVWEGTHKGTLQGPMGALPPTGRRVDVAAVQVVRFDNGKIREVRHYFDLLTLLSQIGAAPRAAAAPPAG